MNQEPPNSASTTREVALALQGGGSHGAFTWGVLDGLLEEPTLEITGATGASAGAMNAVFLADGLVRGGAKEARRALRRFWESIGKMPSANDSMLSRNLSPYDLNPSNVNPLRDLLTEMIDFERLRSQDAVHVAVCATNVWSAKRRVFDNKDISVDAVLASACLPQMSPAVEIDGEPYWDGGWTGNPAIAGIFRDIKDLDSHAIKALLVSRALLVKIKRDVENEIRGLLKNLGLVIGRAKMNVFAARAAELIQDRPELTAAVVPLFKTREVIERQIADLDRKVLQLARNNTQVRRFMTVPGVGPITALCYLATIDDPTRFKKSRSVGAYAGLTTRRYRSGETDWAGRISKCGDALLRTYLYEAANVLLTRIAKWSALKSWGMRIAKRSSLRKANVAVARKLAVILHRMWVDGTEFNWSSKEVAAHAA